MENASSGVHSAIHGNRSKIKQILDNKHEIDKKSIRENTIQLLVRKEWDWIAGIKKYEKYERSNMPFFVGFDIAKIAGRVDVEDFIASKT